MFINLFGALAARHLEELIETNKSNKILGSSHNKHFRDSRSKTNFEACSITYMPLKFGDISLLRQSVRVLKLFPIFEALSTLFPVIVCLVYFPS